MSDYVTSDQMKKEYSDNDKDQAEENQTNNAVGSLLMTTIDTHRTTPTRASTTTRVTRATRATRVVTWSAMNDVGRVICLMMVSVGEKSERMICVNVNGIGWVVPLSELNKAFTCFDEVKSLWSRLYCNKTLWDSSVVKVSEKETLRTLYYEHDIGRGPSKPISCVLLKSLSDVLESVGYDFSDFYGGQYVIGVCTQFGKSVLRVIEWRGQRWCISNEVGYVLFNMPLKTSQGASTFNKLLYDRKLSSLMMNCKHRVILDALKVHAHLSLIPLSHVVCASSLIGLPVDDIVIESDGAVEGRRGSLMFPRRVMIGGSVLGGGTTGLRAITAAADDDDGSVAPLVMIRDLSLYGYGVNERWLKDYLTKHKIMSLSCAISSPLVKRYFGSNKPPRLIPLSVLRLIESDVAHSTAYDNNYGPLIGRPLSGYGTSMAWRQVMVTTVAGWWVDKRLPPVLSGVAGCVAVCSWKGQGWFIPWGLARWLGWAGMRGIVGQVIPEVSCPVWRGRELRALDVLEKAVGRAVVHQGGLIHVSDLEAVIMGHCLWYSEEMKQ